MRTGIARTEYESCGVGYGREYFVSRDMDVVAVRLKADKAGALSFSARLSRAERACSGVAPAPAVSAGRFALSPTLLLHGSLDSGVPGVEGMKYRVAMNVAEAGGSVSCADTALHVDNAAEAWIIVSAATDYSAEGTDFPGERYAAVCDSLLASALGL